MDSHRACPLPFGDTLPMFRIAGIDFTP